MPHGVNQINASVACRAPPVAIAVTSAALWSGISDMSFRQRLGSWPGQEGPPRLKWHDRQAPMLRRVQVSLCQTGGLPYLSPPLETRSFSVFLSSGNDARDLRDRADAMFKVASEVLALKSRVRIEVRRWEHHSSRALHGERVNEVFVAEALRSHLILGLLIQDLRPGTLEELTAALRRVPDRVAVLWFREPGEQASTALDDFLEAWQDVLLYNEVGPADEEPAWLGLVRIVIDFLTRIFHDETEANTRELFYEQR